MDAVGIQENVAGVDANAVGIDMNAVGIYVNPVSIYTFFSVNTVGMEVNILVLTPFAVSDDTILFVLTLCWKENVGFTVS